MHTEELNYTASLPQVGVIAQATYPVDMEAEFYGKPCPPFEETLSETCREMGVEREQVFISVRKSESCPEIERKVRQIINASDDQFTREVLHNPMNAHWLNSDRLCLPDGRTVLFKPLGKGYIWALEVREWVQELHGPTNEDLNGA